MQTDPPLDELGSGPDRAPRRWPLLLLVTALAVGLGVVQVPKALEAREERTDRARVESLVRLNGGDAGGGTRSGGQPVVVYILTNDGPLPLRIRLLRLRGGGLAGEQRRSELADPLLPGRPIQLEVPVTSADCPGAVVSAVDTQLEAVVETADGTQRTVVVPREDVGPFRGASLVDAARAACDRPTPVQAANLFFLDLRVTGDTARGVITIGPTDRTVVLLRLLPTEGLSWSTSTTLPLRVPAGREVRVPVVARKGDCSRVAEIGGQGSIGFELGLETAPSDSYVEPPQVSYTSPGDSGGTEDPLGALRDRLCGVTRATTS